MIDPTREEWRAARDRVWIARGDGLTGQEILRLTEAALGCPCPPEPPPEPLRQLEAVRLWLASPQPDQNKVAGIRQALDSPEYVDRLLTEEASA